MGQRDGILRKPNEGTNDTPIEGNKRFLSERAKKKPTGGAERRPLKGPTCPRRGRPVGITGSEEYFQQEY